MLPPGPQIYETDPVDVEAWHTLGMILTMHTRSSQSGSDTELIPTASVYQQEMESRIFICKIFTLNLKTELK